MFRIGVFELGLTCIFALLLLLIPFIITRYSKRINQHLQDIEKKIDKNR
ncbi:MAG: hypothetical protein JXA13_12380 [Anaerolineales bacterium]|nr:hypothetical protein [Anaerolineales bacterium]